MYCSHIWNRSVVAMVLVSRMGSAFVTMDLVESIAQHSFRRLCAHLDAAASVFVALGANVFASLGTLGPHASLSSIPFLQTIQRLQHCPRAPHPLKRHQ